MTKLTIKRDGSSWAIFRGKELIEGGFSTKDAAQARLPVHALDPTHWTARLKGDGPFDCECRNGRTCWMHVG